jgi:hypothetical protein
MVLFSFRGDLTAKIWWNQRSFLPLWPHSAASGTNHAWGGRTIFASLAFR